MFAMGAETACTRLSAACRGSPVADIVTAEIVPNDDVADAQRGTEHLLDAGEERLAIRRT